MDGILLVDKPKGWTSFDVVAKVRNLVNQGYTSKDSRRTTSSPKVKVGHTGTLDPLATGLLVLLLGSYTKKAPELSKLDKTYEVTMKLGQTSTTGDAEGLLADYKKMRSHKKVIAVEILDVLKSFVGEIEQTPPPYSAIKVDGQRAYKLAREGKEVKLEPRKVTIYDINDLVFEGDLVKFTTRVSSGTYIRSLVEDVGEELGTGAYMSDLRRTMVGKFSIQDATRVDDLSAKRIQKRIKLLPNR